MSGNFSTQYIPYLLSSTSTSLPHHQLINWWSILLYVIAIVLSWLIWTKYDKYIFKTAFIYNAIGWICAMYVGFTANWFIGWFAWVTFLSTSIAMKVIFLKLDNNFIAYYKEENK